MINSILNWDSTKNEGGPSLCAEIKTLFEEQKKEWDLLRVKYGHLNNVHTRDIIIDDFSITLQFNPDRIHSTSANIDKHLVAPKECFLCKENRPAEQRGILYGKYFEILCNPYPILPDHFTIVKQKHSPQSLVLHLNEFLSITKDLGQDFTLFYNGPRCGASAPGHMHFQAITKGVLPVEKEYAELKEGFIKSSFSDDKVGVYLNKNHLRYFISIESNSNKDIILFFKKLHIILKKINPPGIEPLMNVLANYENDTWRLIIFPRAKHRPNWYFETGEKQILVSPAAVDLGGLFVTPRKEDFDKLNTAKMRDIFRQVTVTREQFEYLMIKLK